MIPNGCIHYARYFVSIAVNFKSLDKSVRPKYNVFMDKRHILVRVDGQVVPLKHAAIQCDINYNLVRYRLDEGMSIRDALLSPYRSINPLIRKEKISDIVIEEYP